MEEAAVGHGEACIKWRQECWFPALCDPPALGSGRAPHQADRAREISPTRWPREVGGRGHPPRPPQKKLGSGTGRSGLRSSALRSGGSRPTVLPSDREGSLVIAVSGAPLAIDLFCGLGGWTEGLLDEGYDVVGFDIERHAYGDHRYPGTLVIQDVRTLHGCRPRDWCRNTSWTISKTNSVGRLLVSMKTASSVMAVGLGREFPPPSCGNTAANRPPARWPAP